MNKQFEEIASFTVSMPNFEDVDNEKFSITYADGRVLQYLTYDEAERKLLEGRYMASKILLSTACDGIEDMTDFMHRTKNKIIQVEAHMTEDYKPEQITITEVKF